MKITEAQYTIACEIAARVFDEQLRTVEGASVLAEDHGLNKASAHDFINDYKCLLRGKVFQRAMSAPAMRHFMERIFATRTHAQKQNAVTALRLDIAYFEKHYDTTMHAMRAVADEFEATEDTPRRRKASMRISPRP